MKYTKEYLTNNKVAISCPTVEDWKAVVGELLKETTWMDGDIKISESTWEVYKDKSCVNLYYNGKISYEYTNYYQSKSYTIITAKEFLDDRKTDKFKVGDRVRYNNSLIGTIGCIHNGIAYMSECIDDNGHVFNYPDGCVCEIHRHFMGYFLKNLELIEPALELVDKTKKVEDKPKKTIMKTLTNTLKKILPGDIQTQYKAGFRNGDIELTQEGVTELLNILAEKFQAELTARAEEVIKEEEKKN